MPATTMSANGAGDCSAAAPMVLVMAATSAKQRTGRTEVCFGAAARVDAWEVVEVKARPCREDVVNGAP